LELHDEQHQQQIKSNKLAPKMLNEQSRHLQNAQKQKRTAKNYLLQIPSAT